MNKILLALGILMGLLFFKPGLSAAQSGQFYDKCEFVLVGGKINLSKPLDRFGSSEVGMIVLLDDRTRSTLEPFTFLMLPVIAPFATIEKEEVGTEVDLMKSLLRVYGRRSSVVGRQSAQLKRQEQGNPSYRQKLSVILNDENLLLYHNNYGGLVGRGAVIRQSIDVDYYAKESSRWIQDQSLGIEVGEFNFSNAKIILKLRISRNCQ